MGADHKRLQGWGRLLKNLDFGTHGFDGWALKRDGRFCVGEGISYLLDRL